MAPDHPAKPLFEVLPGTAGTVLSGSALAYAAAIAGSAPRVANFANLLPPERRASHDRVQYLVPAILGILLALAALAVFVIFPAIEQKRYRDDLERAARQLEPAALRAQTIERKINEERNKILLLDEIRRRPQADLEVLNELTRLLPPPVWTNAIEIYPDSVVDNGRGRSGRAAAQSSRFFAAVPELRVRLVSDPNCSDRTVSHQDNKARPRGKDHAVSLHPPSFPREIAGP